MIIRPYSDIIADGFKPADFPCTKMFFPVNETTGSTLTDAVGGGSIGNFANQTMDGTKMTTSGASTSGADPEFGSVAIGTNDAVLFVVADLSATATVIAYDAADAGALILDPSGTGVSDGTNSALTSANADASAVFGHVLQILPGTAGEGNYDKVNTTTYTAGTPANAAPGDLATFANPVTKMSCTFGSGTVLYGIALFVFAGGLPTNYKAAFAWMTAQWQAGNKVIYPGWKGKS